MKKILFALLVAALFFSACRKEKLLFDGRSCKENCFIFKGKVLDGKTLEPLQANIWVKHHTGSLSYWPGDISTIGKISSDANGNYEFRFDDREYKWEYGFFTVEARKEGYIGIGNEWEKAISDIIDSTKYDIPVLVDDLMLRPKASLALSIQINSPEKLTAFNYSYENELSKNIEFFNQGSIPADTLIFHDLVGDLNSIIAYEYSQNNTDTKVMDTLFFRTGYCQSYLIKID